MAKLGDDTLLAMLQQLEEDSAAFTWGELGEARQKALDEYHRRPYGTEEEGWSTIVTSDVQDTVEWILPDLLDIFTSTDKAVIFEPTRAEDVKGAEQATDTVNYVFHQQNDGFLILYTAIKDALLQTNCAVMWRKDERRTKVVENVTGVDEMMLAMMLQEEGAELESAMPNAPQPIIDPATGQPAIDPFTGQPVMGPQTYNARISKIERKKMVKVEAFNPDDLLIKRDWTTPVLTDCPYVCRNMLVTLSDLEQMGFDVEPEDLAGSSDASLTGDIARRGRRGDTELEGIDLSGEDKSQTEGYLRIEFVLADVDGDGIAERRLIYRLQDKILSNEEVSHVQIATASPVLETHTWCGMSLAEVLSDIQQLRTELTRQMLNSAYLSNNPRKKVLTDKSGTPFANIDDLLDNRPGGILRHSQIDAITDDITPFVGGQMLPLLEHVDQMRESRTGVSRQSQGLDANALNERTATAAKLAATSSQKRIKLMARIFAEILFKPMFAGILKLLTDGDMEKVAFMLRNEFVEYDPNEWRDSYNMKANVGLGTGDREHQTVALQGIAAAQGALAQSPFGPLLITPKTIYNTHAKLVENAGFKNVGDFFQDPGDKQVQPPQPPPDPQLQIKQMELEAESQKFQAETQRQREADQRKADVELQGVQANLEIQAMNDARDSERELMKAQFEAQQAIRDDETKREIARLTAENTRYKTDADNATKLQIAGTQQQTAAHAAQQRANETTFTEPHA